MVAQKTGMAVNSTLGWIMHFALGSIVWGGAFAVFNASLPSDSQLMKGIIFGGIAWLLMMLGPMPMSGAGLFGLSLGVMAPVITLGLHIVFGAVMGLTFSKLAANEL